MIAEAIDMNLAEAAKIIEEYNRLVECALKVVSDVPFYAGTDNERYATIAINGEEVVLAWVEYDSDYYGGGSMRECDTRFPSQVLFMTDEELKALRKKVKAEEAERQRKVRAAEQAVERDRAEARDRAEYARLSAKFGAR